MAPRERALWGWSAVAVVLSCAAWFGQPGAIRMPRPAEPAQPDQRERQRLQAALAQLESLARSHESIRATVTPPDLIAPLAAAPVAVPQAGTPIALDRMSVVIVARGGERWLLLDDRTFRVGERLPDGSVLLALRENALELRTATGQRIVHRLGQRPAAAALPSGTLPQRDEQRGAVHRSDSLLSMSSQRLAPPRTERIRS